MPSDVINKIHGIQRLLKASESSSSSSPFRPFPALQCVRTLTNSPLAVVRGSGVETQFEREILQPPYFQINIMYMMIVSLGY